MNSVLQKYCEDVLTEVFIANEYLNLYGKIYEIPIDNKETYEEFQNFWDFAKNSFLYSGTIILAKIYDEDENVKKSLYKILNYSMSNNPTEKVKKQIDTFYKKINDNKEKIENLIYHRNKFYAHNDKISTEKLLERAHLTHGDKLELIKLGKEISEYFLSYSKEEEKVTQFIHIQNSIYELDSIVICLERYKELFDK